MDVTKTAAALSQTQNAMAAQETRRTDSAKEASDYGKTVGNPQLSDKAAEYYKQLKGKFSNMEFVLVSKDEIANAKQNAAKYASKDKMVVLVDEEKIERMATDESYRKKYEGIIAMSQNQLSQMSDKMGSYSGLKGFGMQVNDDGTASFFAVTQKNNETMVKKLSEKRAEKKAAAKKAEKKAEKKAAEEKLANKRAEKKKDEKRARDKIEDEDDYDPKDYEVTTASSMEELFKRLDDREMAIRSDNIMTPEETYVGGRFDFKL